LPGCVTCWVLRVEISAHNPHTSAAVHTSVAVLQCCSTVRWGQDCRRSYPTTPELGLIQAGKQAMIATNPASGDRTSAALSAVPRCVTFATTRLGLQAFCATEGGCSYHVKCYPSNSMRHLAKINQHSLGGGGCWQALMNVLQP
jgi:hypothetical protein